MMMKSVILLVACVAAVYCGAEGQGVSDQQEFTGFATAMGPFCDSACLADGNWRLRRDWFDLQTETEDMFTWSADGDQGFWDGDNQCGSYVNGFINGVFAYSESLLSVCQPDLIYLFDYDIAYDHSIGRMHEKVTIRGSFVPTDDSWDDFIADCKALGLTRYTPTTGLLRVLPQLDGQSISNSYNGDVEFNQWFISNYERNFCTFRGSWSQIKATYKCDFSEDSDSDNVDYVTRNYCLGTVRNEFEIEYDCENGGCDSMDIFFSGPFAKSGETKSVEKKSVAKRSPSAAFFLKGAMTALTGASGQEDFLKTLDEQFSLRSEVMEELKNEDKKRGAAWETQEFESFYDYYYVPFASSRAQPFCAYRR